MTTPQGRGRFGDFDTLALAGHWDDATRAVVLARVSDPPALRFFTAGEASTIAAFCDVALAQDREPRIPVERFIDAKYAAGRRDGYRYADMPDDPAAWRIVIAGLDADAGDAGFAAARPHTRRAVVSAFADGRVDWPGINVARAWRIVMRDALTAYYGHPWAWNEIGFPGPAYPRGYARFGEGMRESWEPAES
jgi:hypothetical protein